MSFSSDVKIEIKNKQLFTSKKRHSKMYESISQSPQEIIIDAFLRSGSISDPEKFYHLEFVCSTSEEAEGIRAALSGYGIVPGVSLRKDHYIVYIKDSEAIADTLVILGATNAVFRFENVRVLKETKENVQRRVNFETANIAKTAKAAANQLADIELIKNKNGFSDLPESLKETAELRINNPDATLAELAEMLPGTGKSGLNHRFRKLAKIAEQIRTEELL